MQCSASNVFQFNSYKIKKHENEKHENKNCKGNEGVSWIEFVPIDSFRRDKLDQKRSAYI